MAFQPVPTYAEVAEVDPRTGKSVFNPAWLSWFLSLSNGGLASNLSNVTGVLDTAHGGTGRITLGTNEVLLGNGVGPINGSANFTYDPAANTFKVAAANVGFYTATPIPQPTTASASAVHAAGAGVILLTDTFDGYTIAQVVKALRDLGLLA